MSIRLLSCLVLLFSFISCSPQVNHSPGFSYDLLHPIKQFELPHSLREISGITFYNDRRLACIQDEKGKIYIYSLKKEDVKESVSFGPDHDYEAIALVNDTFFVLHSTGTLFQITGFDSAGQQTITYDTFLKKENNTEGLCFDDVTHGLLIACKGVSHKKEKEGLKEIYRFDLDSKTLDRQPVFKIHVNQLAKFMSENRLTVPPTEKEGTFFEPSEIAVHPFSKDIYVLSSVGKMIVVMDRSGQIKDVALLDPSVAPHPEGMTFSKDGNLFISSEGSGSKKVILEYRAVK
jgi:uncharacterized protein YjiK